MTSSGATPTFHCHVTGRLTNQTFESSTLTPSTAQALTLAVFCCVYDRKSLRTRSKPLLIAVYVEGALNDGGPLQAADDKRVGPGSLCLHQLTFWGTQREGGAEGVEGGSPDRNANPK